jgi:hypothetical protein
MVFTQIFLVIADFLFYHELPISRNAECRVYASSLKLLVRKIHCWIVQVQAGSDLDS